VIVAHVLLGQLLDQILQLSALFFSCLMYEPFYLAVVFLNSQPSLTNEKVFGLRFQVVYDYVIQEPASSDRTLSAIIMPNPNASELAQKAKIIEIILFLNICKQSLVNNILLIR
jgi:hypothetical protein